MQSSQEFWGCLSNGQSNKLGWAAMLSELRYTSAFGMAAAFMGGTHIPEPCPLAGLRMDCPGPVTHRFVLNRPAEASEHWPI